MATWTYTLMRCLGQWTKAKYSILRHSCFHVRHPIWRLRTARKYTYQRSTQMPQGSCTWRFTLYMIWFSEIWIINWSSLINRTVPGGASWHSLKPYFHPVEGKTVNFIHSLRRLYYWGKSRNKLKYSSCVLGTLRRLILLWYRICSKRHSSLMLTVTATKITKERAAAL